MATKPNTYLNKIKQQPRIKQLMQKGVTTTTIKDVQNATTKQKEQAKEDLLKPIILDNTIRQIMVTDQNFNKLTPRLTFTIKAMNSKGQEILTTQKYNQTIQQTIQDALKNLQNKRGYNEQLKHKGYVNTKIKENMKQELITKIDITITFRKA